MLAPLAPALLSFEAYGRTKSLVRFPFNDDVDKHVNGPQPLTSAMGKIDEYFEWVQARKLCMMYMLSNDGGSMHLYHKSDDAHTEVADIMLGPGKMVFFAMT